MPRKLCHNHVPILTDIRCVCIALRISYKHINRFSYHEKFPQPYRVIGRGGAQPPRAAYLYLVDDVMAFLESVLGPLPEKNAADLTDFDLGAIYGKYVEDEGCDSRTGIDSYFTESA